MSLKKIDPLRLNWTCRKISFRVKEEPFEGSDYLPNQMLARVLADYMATLPWMTPFSQEPMAVEQPEDIAECWSLFADGAPLPLLEALAPLFTITGATDGLERLPLLKRAFELLLKISGLIGVSQVLEREKQGRPMLEATHTDLIDFFTQPKPNWHRAYLYHAGALNRHRGTLPVDEIRALETTAQTDEFQNAINFFNDLMLIRTPESQPPPPDNLAFAEQQLATVLPHLLYPFGYQWRSNRTWREPALAKRRVNNLVCLNLNGNPDESEVRTLELPSPFPGNAVDMVRTEYESRRRAQPLSLHPFIIDENTVRAIVPASQEGSAPPQLYYLDGTSDDHYRFLSFSSSDELLVERTPGGPFESLRRDLRAIEDSLRRRQS